MAKLYEKPAKRQAASYYDREVAKRPIKVGTMSIRVAHEIIHYDYNLNWYSISWFIGYAVATKQWFGLKKDQTGSTTGQLWPWSAVLSKNIVEWLNGKHKAYSDRLAARSGGLVQQSFVIWLVILSVDNICVASTGWRSQDHCASCRDC